jgi:transposase-like protein
VIKDANRKIVQAMIRNHVQPGSQLMTDGLAAYRSLRKEYIHEWVDHQAYYVRGAVHSNGIENFWSLLKRTIKGTYVSVDPLHLQRYLGEQAFRFNERKADDYGRFANVVSSVIGKRLTWKDLTNHALSAAIG